MEVTILSSVTVCVNAVLSALHPYFPDTVVPVVNASRMCDGYGNLDCPLWPSTVFTNLPSSIHPGVSELLGGRTIMLGDPAVDVRVELMECKHPCQTWGHQSTREVSSSGLWHIVLVIRGQGTHIITLRTPCPDRG